MFSRADVIFYRLLGCMNTPKQGLKVCAEHEETTTEFVDEESNKKSNEVQGVIKVLESKETRNSTLYKVRYIKNNK